MAVLALAGFAAVADPDSTVQDPVPVAGAEALRVVEVAHTVCDCPAIAGEGRSFITTDKVLEAKVQDPLAITTLLKYMVSESGGDK